MADAMKQLQAQERMRRRTTDSAGAIVFRQGTDGTEVLLIRMRHDRYSFPKGHMEPGETPEETALREVSEETGITVRLLPGFRVSVPSARAGDQRSVHFYAAEYVSGTLQPQQSELEDALWCPANEAAARVTFPADRDAFGQALGFYRCGPVSAS